MATSPPILSPQTFTGVSTFSNDLQQILQRAVQIASLPVQKLQIDQSDILAQENALTDLGSSVSGLTSSFSSLGLLGANGALTASTSNPAVATARLTGSPSPLSYALSVTSQATAAQAATALALPDSNTTAPRANGLYQLTLGSASESFDLLATGSGRTAGTTGSVAPASPVSVTLNFANGLAGSISANLKGFFVGNATVGGASAGDTVTVNFQSDDHSINTSITTAPLTGTEDATALAGLLNTQIGGNPALNGKVSFSAVNGQLKLVESDTVGTGFTFTSSHTGAVTTGLEPGGAIGGQSAQEIAAALNAQVASNTSLSAAGVSFSASSGQVNATAAAGKQFTFTATDNGQGTGFVSGLAGRTRVVGFANTLSGLRDYINLREPTLGARATVINTSSDPNNPKFDLSLVSDATGTQTLTLLDSTGAELLPNGGALGTNAVFSLNGGPTVTNSSNTITNLVPGLDLTIVGPTSPGTTATITVQKDRTAVQSALQDFVAKYNALVNKLGAQIGKNAGPLSGSSVVLQTSSALRNILGYGISSGSVRSLAALGVLSDDTGHLSLDQGTFNSLSDAQLPDAVSFLGSTTTGFAGNGYSLLTQISDPVSGSIQNEQSFFQASDKRLSDSIARAQDRVSLVQNSLTTQIAQADTLLAQLQSQQNLLTGLFQAQQAISLTNALL